MFEEIIEQLPAKNLLQAALDRAIDQPLDLGRLGDISLHRQTLAPRLLHGSGHVF